METFRVHGSSQTFRIWLPVALLFLRIKPWGFKRGVKVVFQGFYPFGVSGLRSILWMHSAGKTGIAYFSNHVQITLMVNGFENFGYKMVNIQEQKLLEGIFPMEGISVNDLPEGMHVIQISSNFNKQILSTKFFEP